MPQARGSRPKQTTDAAERHPRQTRASGVRGASLAVAGVLIAAAYGPKFLGTRGEDVPEGSLDAALRASVAAKLTEMSPTKLYEASYIEPIREGDDIPRPGARGLFGMFAGYDPVDRTFGQSCLAGTPYDTSVDRRVPAVPEFDGNTFRVFPGGSAAPPLVFTVGEGELMPSDKTQQTLSSLSSPCVRADGLPVFRGQHRVTNSEFETVRQVEPLHPSDYVN